MASPNDAASGLIIKPLEEKDGPAIARLWLDGLDQTSDDIFFLLRPIARSRMKKYGAKAMNEDGDVGPDGKNLYPSWANKEDRSLFVAFLPEALDTVVGCVGVKRGMHDKKVEPESTVASIWRMSVDSTVRRRGLGQKLMETACEWAIEHGCTTMGLWTSNPTAAKFYCDKIGFVEVETFVIPGSNPWIQNPIIRYTKTLVPNKNETETSETG